MSYAQFETSCSEEGIDSISVARRVFERGNEALRRGGTSEEREGILQAWYRFEEENGDDDSKVKVKNMLPKRIKKRVPYTSENGVRTFFYTFKTICSTCLMFILIILERQRMGREDRLHFPRR